MVQNQLLQGTVIYKRQDAQSEYVKEQILTN